MNGVCQPCSNIEPSASLLNNEPCLVHGPLYTLLCAENGLKYGKTVFSLRQNNRATKLPLPLYLTSSDVETPSKQTP